MDRVAFEAEVPGGTLGGWRTSDDGPEVLLLHGGPGASYEYLDGLAEELGAGFRIAAYQQRGIAPSTLEGPFAVEQEIADAVAVLDALGWERAWVVGHSWGGHLLVHIAVAVPERLHGALAIDPLGSVGDGGYAAFEAEMVRRTPEQDRERAMELDERAMRGEGTDEESLESLRLVWPAYFAARDVVLPFDPRMRVSVPAYSGVFDSLFALRPQLESALPGMAMPFGFLAGTASPMPHDQAAAATADAIPGAWLELAQEAGHFPWFERPGCARAALQRLVAG